MNGIPLIHARFDLHHFTTFYFTFLTFYSGIYNDKTLADCSI